MAWKPYPAQTLTQNDAFVTKTNGTVALMTDIYVWTIPRNVAILINPTDVISAYLKDVGAETLATDSWQLQIRNAASGEQVNTVTSGIYAHIKEFQDQTKVKRIGGKYLLESDYQLAFMVNATTVLVNASCYISIGCTKYVKVSPAL
jgi:hypothetical protein